MSVSKATALPRTALTVAVVVARAMFACWRLRQTDRALRDELLEQARLLAQTTDIERVKALSSNEPDPEKPESLQLRDEFAAVSWATAVWQCAYFM